MTTLPSFVELMASLGLENRDTSDSQSLNRHSRSSSYSSSSSVASQTSSDSSHSLFNRVPHSSPSIIVSASPGKDVELDRRRHHIRYSPYSPAISHIRRGSLPSNVKEEELEEELLRTGSSSPRCLSPPRQVGRRSSAVGLSNGTKRPQKLTLDADLIANMPISTFLRRKTPQSSPISPTFPYRSKRSSSPSLPVSIPTLPTFFFPQQQQQQPFIAAVNFSSDTDDDAMSDSPATDAVPIRRQRKPVSGRQRSSSRLSEPDLSSRRSRHRRRISPLA